MSKYSLIAGTVYGRLTVIKCVEPDNFPSIAKWEVLCACGVIKNVRAACLVNGKTLSCGCLGKESVAEFNTRTKTTHGMFGTPLWHSWSPMMQRCYNPKCPHFSYYGGRGIIVCAFLRESPANIGFMIGEKSKGMTLDRIDTNGNYSCGLCDECQEKGLPMNIRWATRLQQARNQRNVTKVTIKGITKAVFEWAEISGLTVGAIKHRIKAGWENDSLLEILR